MFPKGVIYQKGVSPKKGVVGLHPNLAVKLGYLLVRGIGAGLIGAAVIGLIFTYAPIIKEEALYALKGPQKVKSSSFGELIQADRWCLFFGCHPQNRRQKRCYRQC